MATEGEPFKRPRTVSFSSSTIVHDLEGSFSDEDFVESANNGSLPIKSMT